MILCAYLITVAKLMPSLPKKKSLTNDTEFYQCNHVCKLYIFTNYNL